MGNNIVTHCCLFQKLTNVLCFSFKNQPKMNFQMGQPWDGVGRFFEFLTPPDQENSLELFKICHAFHTSSMIDRRQHVLVQLKNNQQCATYGFQPGTHYLPQPAANQRTSSWPNLTICQLSGVPRSWKQPSFSSGERHEFTEAVVKTGLTYN